MKKLIFVSITIFLTISIDICLSQFAAIHQPKAIRNGAEYHQEIFYGSIDQQQQQRLQQQQQYFHQQPLVKFNVPQQQFIQKPVSFPTSTPTTTTSRVEEREIFDEEEEFENTPRPIQPSIVRQVPILRQQPTGFPFTTKSTTQRPKTTTESLTSEEVDEQAKSAYYNFGTSVHDTINDHEHVRHEQRDGLTLKGMYAYSDGFFKRTVYYEADEGGYRVTKEEVQPINGDGPKFNPRGQAEVKSTLAGDYSITVDDFRLSKQQEKILNGDKN